MTWSVLGILNLVVRLALGDRISEHFRVDTANLLPEVGIVALFILIGIAANVVYISRISKDSADNASKVLREVQSRPDFKLSYNALESRDQIEQIIVRIRESLEPRDAKTIHVFEANLQPLPPTQDLKGLRDLFETFHATEKIKWHLVVGSSDSKQAWIQRLKEELVEKYPNTFYLYENAFLAPGINFVSVPNFSEVYLGMGKWQNNKKHRSGGLWLRSDHFCDFVQSYIEYLAKMPTTKQLKAISKGVSLEEQN